MSENGRPGIRDKPKNSERVLVHVGAVCSEIRHGKLPRF